MDLEDRKIELIDELWFMLDALGPDQSVGSLLRRWAEKALELEQEEHAATIAFLEYAGAPKAYIDMLARGDHRRRSTQAMKAVRDSSSKVLTDDRKDAIEDMVRDYVGAGGQ